MPERIAFQEMRLKNRHFSLFDLRQDVGQRSGPDRGPRFCQEERKRDFDPERLFMIPNQLHDHGTGPSIHAGRLDRNQDEILTAKGVGDDRASRSFEVDDDELRPISCLINSFDDGVLGQAGEYFQVGWLVR